VIADTMFSLGVPWWELVVRSMVIYLALLVALRIFGKREVGQFTLFDIVVVLLVANAVQPAMTGPDNSLTGGLIVIAALVLTNRMVSLARERVPWFRDLLQAKPTVIGRDGEWIRAAIENEGLDDDDIEAALREHGVGDISEVKLAVLEPDGSISVVPKGGGRPRQRSRRRVRILRKR
jgi:uncharacterized membrane protein YcaP (DUF421 family)